jgi:hypothetical protein
MRGCEAIVVELPGYVGGKLDAGIAVTVQRHVQACAACQAELRSLERLERLLSVGLPTIAPSPAFASTFANRLAAEIADEGEERARSLLGWFLQPWLIPVAAAAILAGIMFTPWFANEQESGWSFRLPGVDGGIASNKPGNGRGTAKGPEKSAVAGVPQDLMQRPELFVDYAVIRDLDILEGQAGAG